MCEKYTAINKMNRRLTLLSAKCPSAGKAGDNLSTSLLWWFSCANQLESFFLVPVPSASHWLAMVLYGRGDVVTDVPTTCPATSSAWKQHTLSAYKLFA